jgi:DNA (cytosine-5)-methyltransferase 1
LVADSSSKRTRNESGKAGRQRGEASDAHETKAVRQKHRASVSEGVVSVCCDVSDTNSERLEKRQGKDARGAGPFCWTEPSRSEWWAIEPDVGRVADGIPNRVHRLRGLGNAVVPQVAEYIGRQIVASHGATP